MEISGIWLPIITPFVDGAVDLASYERMLVHYLDKGVTGIFPLGTTGAGTSVFRASRTPSRRPRRASGRS
jgi:4-hydroxy-tetrahydrodipicolinate synthase